MKNGMVRLNMCVKIKTIKPKDLSSKTYDHPAVNYFSQYYYYYLHAVKFGRVLFLSNLRDFVVRFSALGAYQILPALWKHLEPGRR